MKEHGINGFMCTEDVLAGLGGLGRFNGCKKEWNWEKFVAYTEMHRTRSS